MQSQKQTYYNKQSKLYLIMKKFTIYLGLNDKDTRTQLIDTVEAFKIVSNLITADFDGGTIFAADGIYKHDDGSVIVEKTLRIELLFTTIEAVRPFVATLKKLFNQESVAVQEETINSQLM